MASRKLSQGIGGCGLEKRRSPRGGAAKGIPRNTFTGSSLPSTVACFPCTHPCLVYLRGSSVTDPEKTQGRAEKLVGKRKTFSHAGFFLHPEATVAGTFSLKQGRRLSGLFGNHHHRSLPQLLLRAHHHTKELLLYDTKVALSLALCRCQDPAKWFAESNAILPFPYA